jgi:hypothetical protein
LAAGTTRDEVRHFVVVYDRRSGLKDIRRYEAEQHAEAVNMRYRLEDRYRDDTKIEVVLLSAASEEVIRHTHGRYSKTLAELATFD